MSIGHGNGTDSDRAGLTATTTRTHARTRDPNIAFRHLTPSRTDVANQGLYAREPWHQAVASDQGQSLSAYRVKRYVRPDTCVDVYLYIYLHISVVRPRHGTSLHIARHAITALGASVQKAERVQHV